jgi:hypothetical protein
MTSIDPLIVFWFLFFIVLVLVAWWGIKSIMEKGEGYTRRLHGEPRDVDLRLTYKRFKQLYPYSQITYQEYKKLQMERSFKRAVSSEKNRRMVS